MNLELFGNIIGGIGTFFIVLGYFLTQTGKITSKNISFTNFNFFGSLFLAISLIIHFNLPSLILQIILMIIGLIGYFRYFKNKK